MRKVIAVVELIVIFAICQAFMGWWAVVPVGLVAWWFAATWKKQERKYKGLKMARILRRQKRQQNISQLADLYDETQRRDGRGD